MAEYKMEQKDFVPHPPGPSEGICYGVEDLGEVPGFGGDLQHKLIIKFESIKHFQLDEMGVADPQQPYTIWYRCTLAGGKQANLRKIREKMMGRPLTGKEAYNFDDGEVLDVRIGYVVAHRVSEEGRTWANISPDGIWRLDDQTKGTRVNDLESGRREVTAGGADDRDLPF